MEEEKNKNGRNHNGTDQPMKFTMESTQLMELTCDRPNCKCTTFASFGGPLAISTVGLDLCHPLTLCWCMHYTMIIKPLQ